MSMQVWRPGQLKGFAALQYLRHTLFGFCAVPVLKQPNFGAQLFMVGSHGVLCVPVPAPSQSVRKLIAPIVSWRSWQAVPATGQPAFVMGLQLAVQRVTPGMAMPLPSSSWTRQSPPGAVQSASVLQNLSQVATVLDTFTQTVPGEHTSPARPHCWPQATLP